MTDWVNVLDAAYAPNGDDLGWAKDLTDAVRAVFPGQTLGFSSVRHDASLKNAELTLAVGEAAQPLANVFREWTAMGGPQMLDVFYYRPAIVSTLQTNMRRISPEVVKFMAQTMGSAGWADSVGLVMQPQPGVATALFATSPKPIELRSRERLLYTRLALHIEAAHRLRCRPSHVRGILSSGGKLLDAEGTLEEQGAALGERVRRIEEARSRSRRFDAESLDLWHALVDGRMSLVARREGTRRHYLVVDNAPERRSMRALTKAEVDVVAGAARGMTPKMIAYGLGISAGAVSMRLSSSAAKVGLATRLELVRLAALLAGSSRANFDEATLTDAEREVLELVAQGLSNREIARLRGRSIRTIANQVASLLRKSKSASRSAMATRG